MNAEKSKIARPHQIKYLGYGFYYTKTGIVKPKPHLKSIQKFKSVNPFLKLYLIIS